MLTALRVRLRPCNMLCRARLALALCFLSPAITFCAGSKKVSSGQFQTTNIWTTHFHFEPEQWDAMEPEESGGGMFGGPRPGGPGAFGPGMFLAPAFFQADTDRDQKVTHAEFQQLASKWFEGWDKKKSGALKEEDLREGLNATIGLPGGGGAGPRMISLQGASGKRNGLASAAGIEFDYVKADLQI